MITCEECGTTFINDDSFICPRCGESCCHIKKNK
jgi:hypothetical protein